MHYDHIGPGSLHRQLVHKYMAREMAGLNRATVKVDLCTFGMYRLRHRYLSVTWYVCDYRIPVERRNDESTLKVGSPLHSLTTSLSDTTGKWVFKRVRSLSNGRHR